MEICEKSKIRGGLRVVTWLQVKVSIVLIESAKRNCYSMIKKRGIRNDLMVWRCGAMAMFRIVLMTRAFLIGPYVFMWGLQAEVETVWGVKKPPLHRDNAIPGISISALIIIAHYCDS
jgi:hypothetical protein